MLPRSSALRSYCLAMPVSSCRSATVIAVGDGARTGWTDDGALRQRDLLGSHVSRLIDAEGDLGVTAPADAEPSPVRGTADDANGLVAIGLDLGLGNCLGLPGR